MIKLAVLASHEGSTLQAVLDACQQRRLQAEVVLVVSNNSRSGAIRRAQTAQVKTMHLSSRVHGDEATVDNLLVESLKAANADHVLLLGYMKKLGPKTLSAYTGRILNTHPALLPKYGGQGFYGRKVHEAVLVAGDRETGATIHQVDGEYDTGPIISQVRVPVNAGDDVEMLEQRVKKAEQTLLVETLVTLAHQHAQQGSQGLTND